MAEDRLVLNAWVSAKANGRRLETLRAHHRSRLRKAAHDQLAFS